MIMRTSSSIIAVLAFASAAAAAKSRRLRSTIRHHRAVEDRRAQTTNDSIRCTYSYLGDRIRVYVQNTEQRSTPAANYLVIWS